MNLTLVRVLTLLPADHPRGQPHISSASGLVCNGDWAYVVADDEQHLARFRVGTNEPGQLLRAFGGDDLPVDAKARKAAKPDLETLFVTPPFDGQPQGALVAFGSGSRDTRHRAVWFALDGDGLPSGAAHELSLDSLYGPLHERFHDLNIEGAFVDGDHLRVLQRGHAGDPVNACISFAWPAIAAWLAGAAAPQPVSVQTFDLGTVDGVPLCFTDGAPLADGTWLFCAVAEATASTYLDGACVGAAIGSVGPDGTLQTIRRLEQPWKVEGINAVRDSDGWQLRLVTDADDPDAASLLLQADWR